MGLTKAKGNMYPWVTHLWNPISGRCPHDCSYCYVKAFRHRSKSPKYVLNAAYYGELSAGDNDRRYLFLKEPFSALGKDKTIFVGHMIDMFAWPIPTSYQDKVMEHCCNKYPDNQYVFQTKNPRALFMYHTLPQNSIVGTTIETNNAEILKKISDAPPPAERSAWLNTIKHLVAAKKTFITIEPIMDFTVERFAPC